MYACVATQECVIMSSVHPKRRRAAVSPYIYIYTTIYNTYIYKHIYCTKNVLESIMKYENVWFLSLRFSLLRVFLSFERCDGLL